MEDTAVSAEQSDIDNARRTWIDAHNGFPHEAPPQAWVLPVADLINTERETLAREVRRMRDACRADESERSEVLQELLHWLGARTKTLSRNGC
jgi:hypothetical protein